ncbi:hypothetical protein Dsin_015020 [Dipteronia sinensis]|uniref:Peptidase C14 caspase domain-containing protein n=1 Tax=Dipteronia sinensis TaxID=43782 RepID=A0AAE0EC50_9ROSI|nr:hypothetical protein Dsin_015020 [Dipteronia sinensis]
MVVMVLLTSWEVVSARELSDRQSGTVKPSLHRNSASLRESPPAPAAPVYPKRKAKKAVLVGCNYPNTKNELHGCINDVVAMKEVLIERFRFEPSGIELLTDATRPGSNLVMPTGANIKAALKRMVDGAEAGDVLFFHYSGRETRIPSMKPGCPFRQDEAIVPTDFNLITDQKDVVKALGFGSLLSTNCGRLRRYIYSFVMDKFDIDTLSVELYGKMFNLSTNVYSQIMENSRQPISLDGGIKQIKELIEIYKGTSMGIKVNVLIEKMKILRSADDEFKITFMLFVIGTVLCSQGGIYIFYLHHVKWNTLLVDRSKIPVTAWTNDIIKKFTKWLQQQGGLESTKLSSHFINVVKIDGGANSKFNVGNENILHVVTNMDGRLKLVEASLNEIMKANGKDATNMVANKSRVDDGGFIVQEVNHNFIDVSSKDDKSISKANKKMKSFSPSRTASSQNHDE